MSEPFVLPATERLRVLRREGGDVAYHVDIAFPDGSPPPRGWPSIWLLDAAGCFGTCVEALRRMSRRPDATGVSPMVVVGISAEGDAYDVARRHRDFTTTRAADPGVATEADGAAEFLQFLDGQVMDTVATCVPIDRDRRTLFGHSLAGYFALWALCHHPDVFRGCAAISPSIWWDPERLRVRGPALAAHSSRLLLAAGEWEEALPPWQQGGAGSEDVLARRQARRMIANARELGEVLRRSLPPGHVEFALLADEDHASIVSAAMPRALRLASRG